MDRQFAAQYPVGLLFFIRLTMITVQRNRKRRSIMLTKETYGRFGGAS